MRESVIMRRFMVVTEICRSETWGGKGNRYGNNLCGGQGGDFRGKRQGGGGGFPSSGGFQGRGGFKGNRDQNNRGQGGFQSYGGQGGNNAGGQGNWGHERNGGNKPRKPINPLDQNGKRQLCSSCGSFRHFLQDCKDSWENINKSVLLNEIDENEMKLMQNWFCLLEILKKKTYCWWRKPRTRLSSIQAAQQP